LFVLMRWSNNQLTPAANLLKSLKALSDRDYNSPSRRTAVAIEMVLTIISRDRPGLVQTLSQVVVDHSGNWIDSSMARLGGEFAGILRVDVPERSIAGFESSLAALADQGIAVTVRRDSTAPIPRGRRAHLDLTGADHPGIVRDISSALVQHGVSIDELHTEVRPRSMTGEPLFTAQAIVILPEGLTTDALREQLERIANDIMVDLALTETDNAPAER
jgi:glycine cleavage system regulatory protein